jgi:hypothetical protein
LFLNKDRRTDQRKLWKRASFLADFIAIDKAKKLIRIVTSVVDIFIVFVWLRGTGHGGYSDVPWGRSL